MVFHDDARTGKPHSFHFQPEALFTAGVAAKFDLASRAHHPLPGKRFTAVVQHASDVAVVERVAGGGRYLSVGGHIPAGNLENNVPDRGVTLRRRTRLLNAPQDLGRWWIPALRH